MSKRLVFLALASALVLMSGAVSASTFVALNSRGMVENSDRVVQGRVIGQESFWNEDGRLIVTDVTIQVSETLIGQSSAQVTVRVPGGKVGDLLVVAEGFPSFEQGSEVILFLADSPEGDFQRIIGHQQGHFEVVDRLDGVRLAVPQIEEGTRLFTPSGRLQPQARSTELDEFKNLLRGLGATAGKIVN